MKLFQKTLTRRYSCYKEVKRPKEFKYMKGPEIEPLSKILDAKIKAAGPLSVAEYMRTVLTNPLTGYYMKRDVFGHRGDFVTSPEITQMFGEIVGIWVLYELKKLGLPKPFQIVELGPGRGTLTKDVLKVLSNFKSDQDLSVHMVEISPQMASIQAQILCNDAISFGMMPQQSEDGPHYKKSKTSGGLPIYWYKNIEHVPKNFTVILAHEFFDALPIHKYQKMPEGWREVLINSRTDEKGGVKFEYTLSKTDTPLSKLFIREDETREHVEISPDSGKIAKHIADRLEEDGGFALLMDYGHDGTKTDTFRAFKKHQLHDPLIDPGTADLTADVDFSFLREILKSKLLVFGPAEQGNFLVRMGIEARLQMLLDSVSDEKSKEILKSGYKTIVDKNQMGERYKCMAAFPKVLKAHLEKFPVAGFFDGESK